MYIVPLFVAVKFVSAPVAQVTGKPLHLKSGDTHVQPVGKLVKLLFCTVVLGLFAMNCSIELESALEFD